MISFRSNGADYYKPDPGVVPCNSDCEKDGIQVIMTGVHHTNLEDRGPDDVKDRIAKKLAELLDDEKPLPKKAPTVIAQYAPGAPY